MSNDDETYRENREALFVVEWFKRASRDQDFDREKLLALTELRLDRRGLFKIPGPTCVVLGSRLTVLSLQRNRIKTLPREVGLLKSLRELYLRNNLIREVPTEIGSLANLQQLHLQYNRLVSLPDELAQLTSLEELHTEGNGFQKTTAKQIMGLLPHLRWFSHDA